MPCNSDYLNPTRCEEETRRAAKLLIYVKKALGLEVERWLTQEASRLYASDERIIPLLCSVLSSMSDADRERVVYDAHKPMARDLADFWDEHKAADTKRLGREAKLQRQEKIRQQALAKVVSAANLTLEEMEALGLE